MICSSGATVCRPTYNHEVEGSNPPVAVRSCLSLSLIGWCAKLVDNIVNPKIKVLLPGNKVQRPTYVPTYSLIPTWRKKSANQNPLLRNVEAFSPPREVCAASSFLCVISGCNQSMLTTAPFNVTLHDYNLRLRTQTVSSGEH